MENNIEELIAEYIDKDENLRKLVEEHRRYEALIEEFNKRVYLTAEEEIEKKTIQKLKLVGKEKIYKILSQY